MSDNSLETDAQATGRTEQRPPATVETPSDDRPFVSVVIPVYEDPEGLAVTLRSLVDQTYPDDRYEVVVVDNDSSDRTPDVAAAFARDHEPVRTVVETTSGSYAARNRGIRESNGSILSFVDADMAVDPDWLEAVVDRLESSGAAYLGCAVELGETAGSASLAERYTRRTAFPIRTFIEDEAFAPTCCLTVRRDVFEDVGPFDARLVSSGDREFGNRVADAGYELEFAADVTMTHPPRRSVGELTSKAVRLGRGYYQIRWLYPERYGSPVARLLNPLSYTPPLPRSMRAHVSGWDDLSRTDQAAFLLLAWLLTVSKAYGSLMEAAARATRSRPTAEFEPTGGDSPE